MADAAPRRTVPADARARIRTPEHIARLVAELAALRPADVICDPVAGGCELLAAAMQSVRASFPALGRNAGEAQHFRAGMFHAFGADSPPPPDLARDIDVADLRADDVLDPALADRPDAFTHVLTRLPFEGRRAHAHTAKDLLRMVRTTRLELLLLARILQLLRVGGRAAVIVPERLLSGATKAHQRVRALLVEKHKVDGVIALPSGVFLPYFADPSAILLFKKTQEGGTVQVWFYAVAADGMSLDRARTPLVDPGKLGPLPQMPLSPEEASRNDLPDALARWRALQTVAGSTAALAEPRSARSFYVSKGEIAAQGYDLSMRRYQLPAPAHAELRRPHEILAELAGLEAEIFQGMKDLVGWLK